MEARMSIWKRCEKEEEQFGRLFAWRNSYSEESLAALRLTSGRVSIRLIYLTLCQF